MNEVENILQSQKERKEKYQNKSAVVALIGGIIADAKQFFTSIADKQSGEITSATFKVEVQNPTAPVEVQKVEGLVSVNEMKSLLAAISDVNKSINSLSGLPGDVKSLADTLKPLPVDFSELERAIKSIEIPETVIPNHPDKIVVSNLSEVVDAVNGLIKSIPVHEKVSLPEYPKSVSINNLGDVSSSLDKIHKLIGELAKKPTELPDMKPVVEAVKGVMKAVNELVFPVPTFNFPKFKIESNSQAARVTHYLPDSQTKVDYTSSSSIYIAMSPAGTATSSDGWYVERISISGTVVTIQHGSGTYDNRASLTYT